VSLQCFSITPVKMNLRLQRLPRDGSMPLTAGVELKYCVLSFYLKSERRRQRETVAASRSLDYTKLTTLNLKLHGSCQREAAVRYKKNGCRISTRPSDRPGTDDDRSARRRAPERRRLVRTPKRPVRATRPFIWRFRATWLFRTTWHFRSPRSPQE